MFVLKSTYDAIVADRDRWKGEADRGVDLLAKAREDVRTLDRVAATFQSERNTARDELASYKSARDRSLAPLRAANEARRAKAAVGETE